MITLSSGFSCVSESVMKLVVAGLCLLGSSAFQKFGPTDAKSCCWNNKLCAQWPVIELRNGVAQIDKMELPTQAKCDCLQDRELSAI